MRHTPFSKTSMPPLLPSPPPTRSFLALRWCSSVGHGRLALVHTVSYNIFDNIFDTIFDTIFETNDLRTLSQTGTPHSSNKWTGSFGRCR